MFNDVTRGFYFYFSSNSQPPLHLLATLLSTSPANPAKHALSFVWEERETRATSSFGCVMGITVNDVISCFCSYSCVSEFPRDYARRGSFFTLPFQIASLGHNLILFLTSSHNRKYKCFSAPSGLSRSKSERRRTYKHIM